MQQAQAAATYSIWNCSEMVLTNISNMNLPSKDRLEPPKSTNMTNMPCLLTHRQYGSLRPRDDPLDPWLHSRRPSYIPHVQLLATERIWASVWVAWRHSAWGELYLPRVWWAVSTFSNFLQLSPTFSCQAGHVWGWVHVAPQLGRDAQGGRDLAMGENLGNWVDSGVDPMWDTYFVKSQTAETMKPCEITCEIMWKPLSFETLDPQGLLPSGFCGRESAPGPPRKAAVGSLRLPMFIIFSMNFDQSGKSSRSRWNWDPSVWESGHRSPNLGAVCSCYSSIRRGPWNRTDGTVAPCVSCQLTEVKGVSERMGPKWTSIKERWPVRASEM